MFGLGSQETMFVVIVLALLVGASVLPFALGYVMGRARGQREAGERMRSEAAEGYRHPAAS
jgi:Sec-independent protein translocase protein TatA